MGRSRFPPFLARRLETLLVHVAVAALVGWRGLLSVFAQEYLLHGSLGDLIAVNVQDLLNALWDRHSDVLIGYSLHWHRHPVAVARRARRCWLLAPPALGLVHAGGHADNFRTLKLVR